MIPVRGVVKGMITIVAVGWRNMNDMKVVAVQKMKMKMKGKRRAERQGKHEGIDQCDDHPTDTAAEEALWKSGLMTAWAEA